LAIYHHFVSSVEAQASGFLKFGALPKVALQLRGIPEKSNTIRLGFKNGGRDSFLMKYKSILCARPWVMICNFCVYP